MSAFRIDGKGVTWAAYRWHQSWCSEGQDRPKILKKIGWPSNSQIKIKKRSTDCQKCGKFTMGERTRMWMCETEVFMKNQAMCEIFVVLLPDTGQLKEEKSEKETY